MPRAPALPVNVEQQVQSQSSLHEHRTVTPQPIPSIGALCVKGLQPALTSASLRTCRPNLPSALPLAAIQHFYFCITVQT